MGTQLKRKVMRRVRTVYILKRVLSPFMVKLYGLIAVVLAVSGSLVSVPNVVANFMNVISGGTPYSFIVSAFTHTELAVQIGSLVVLLLVIWMVRDMVSGPQVSRREHAAI